jgi:hypothetical protein
MDNDVEDTSSATISCPFLLLVFLALFLRKIRDLQQRLRLMPHITSHISDNFR